MQFSQGRGGGPIGLKEERGMEAGRERWKEGERKKKDKERRRERKRKRPDLSLEAVITLYSLGSGLPCGSKGDRVCSVCWTHISGMDLPLLFTLPHLLAPLYIMTARLLASLA